MTKALNPTPDAATPDPVTQVRADLLRDISEGTLAWLGQALTSEQRKAARRGVLQRALTVAALDAQRLGAACAQATGHDLTRALRLSIERTLPQLELEALGGTNNAALVLFEISAFTEVLRDTIVTAHLDTPVSLEISAMKKQLWSEASERLRSYALGATREALQQEILAFQSRGEAINLIDATYRLKEPGWSLAEQLGFYWQLAQGAALGPRQPSPTRANDPALFERQRALWRELGLEFDMEALRTIREIHFSAQPLDKQVADAGTLSDHERHLLRAVQLSKSG